MKTALFSAHEKTEGLASFAIQLSARKWELLASSGTCSFLKKRGIEARDVASLVGEPILDHRVVTLSREIYAGLLSRKEDEPELLRLKIRRIDLVYVDLYPLEKEIDGGGAEASVLEKTDIGGPTLLRAAAKGRRIVISNEAQIPEVLSYLDSREADAKFLAKLAAAAEERVAQYCSASAAFNAQVSR